MAASSLSLTTRSVNDVVITSETRNFIVARMTEIKANGNLDTTHAVTEAGDASNQLSAWAIYGTGEKLYWTLTNPTGTTYNIDLYRGYQGIHVAHGTRTGNGVCFFYAVNQSGISGNVTITFSAADTDNANIVYCSTFVDEADLELPGTTQFMYDMGNGYLVKHTVDETVSAINAAIDGDSQFLDADEDLTTAQITTLGTAPVEIITAPGAGYVIEIQSAFINYDRATADITGNVDIDLISTTTGTALWRATNGISGSSDKITRFVAVAGVADANEGISICAGSAGTPGDPTMTTSTGTASVTVTYKITAI